MPCLTLGEIYTNQKRIHQKPLNGSKTPRMRRGSNEGRFRLARLYEEGSWDTSQYWFSQIALFGNYEYGEKG